jgi:hypothetical protein
MMRSAKPISALMAATVSAITFAGFAVLVAPLLSFLVLLTKSSSATFGADAFDGWMGLAVLAPLAASALGFISGWLMASTFNLFVTQEIKPRPAIEAVRQVRVVSISAGTSIDHPSLVGAPRPY